MPSFCSSEAEGILSCPIILCTADLCRMLWENKILWDLSLRWGLEGYATLLQPPEKYKNQLVNPFTSSDSNDLLGCSIPFLPGCSSPSWWAASQSVHRSTDPVPSPHRYHPHAHPLGSLQVRYGTHSTNLGCNGSKHLPLTDAAINFHLISRLVQKLPD